MAGALAERVFVEKLEGVGFEDVQVHDRQAISLDDVAGYPLFTPDLLELMAALLGPEQRERVAVAVTLSARRAA